MENEKRQHASESDRTLPEEKKQSREEEIDEELEQTFPASDPPSYSKPGNDKEEDA